MNISTVTNISSPVHTDQKTVTAEQSSNGASSKDVAAVSNNPSSVKVSLSATENAQAASNAALPPLYSKVSLNKTSQEQLYTNDDQRAGPEETIDNADLILGGQDSERSASDDESDSDEKVPVSGADEQRDTGERNSRESEKRVEDAEKTVVDELKARDREVRTHEQAHKAVGGQYAGAASFSYQTGPDGQRYAVGGEVSIDISPVPNNPEATITKMTTVKAAANAPAEPSSQDRAVAAEAQRIIAQAQADVVQEKQEELEQARLQAEEKKAERERAEEQAESRKSSSGSQSISVQEFEKIASLDTGASTSIDSLI